jgi:hypothetical protein
MSEQSTEGWGLTVRIGCNVTWGELTMHGESTGGLWCCGIVVSCLVRWRAIVRDLRLLYRLRRGVDYCRWLEDCAMKLAHEANSEVVLINN